MKNTYDQSRAEQLVPLLEVIVAEIVDRTRRAKDLEGKREPHAEGSRPSSSELERRAALAVQRRGIQLSIRELECLGCVVDEQDLTRVYIPGTDGKMKRGFSWQSGEKSVRVVTAQPGKV
ncbi:MAG: hypothetical protein ACI8QZ_004082 [Chlamydiales bacterium]|jgi:hypothetical protein